MIVRRRGPQLDEWTAEQLLGRRAGTEHPDLHQAMVALRSLADGPAPPPAAALAELLDRGFEPAVPAVRRPPVQRRRRSWAARVGGVVAAGIASILVAGTAQALPPALQDGVADLVSALTPFELPRPAPHDTEPRGTEDDQSPASPEGRSSTPGRTPTPAREASAPAEPSASDTEPVGEPVGEPVDAAGDPGEDAASPEHPQRDGRSDAEDPADDAADVAPTPADDVEDPAEDIAEVHHDQPGED